jgi:hypothetical protein
MSLFRNLKKMWKNTVRGYSDGLSSPSTKQKAKQTLKKRNNSSRTTSSRKPLTQENQHTTIATSSADTSEKIIMEKTIEPVKLIREWSINRIHDLAEGDIESQFDAVAIAEEFDEWINIPPDVEEMTYLALEEE